MNPESVLPGIFHLHIDGQALSPDADAIIKHRFGFVDGDFCGHPEGYRHFEPNYHRILKLEDRTTFNRIFDELEFVAKMHDFQGYIEGEYIKTDVIIQNGDFDDSVAVPFRINRRLLRGEPEEPFREAELHLVMNKDESDERLIKKLLAAGLYGAHIPKADHIAIVLTAQGYIRDIDRLMPQLTETARSIRALSDLLARHPEALIKGRTNTGKE